MRTDPCLATQHPLSTLITEAEAFLRQQPYWSKTIQRVRCTWRALASFAQTDPDGATFSLDLVQRFLREQYGYPPADDLHPITPKLQVRLRAMRMLVDFALHGRWVYHSRTTPALLSPDHQRLLETFLADWSRRGASARTLRPCKVRLRQFFLYLQEHDLTYRQLTPAVISAFLTTQLEFRQKTVQMITYYLRTLLRFLYLQEYLPADLSGDVPHVRVIHQRRIPSTWRAEDVTRLLAAVDRGNPTGKRDYAILVLVTRLGLRVGDIRELRLEHFHWETHQLVFPQAKTGQVVSLPLLDEIGWAVIDYLQHGRPQTEARQVFVRHKAPFGPFGPNNNLYHLIDGYRQRAGIALPTEQRHGLHSLRHTLASALLEQQTPLSTIAAILGHLDSSSTKVYLKVDLAHLRQCALDPEEVLHATE